jgi:hypothetical protein
MMGFEYATTFGNLVQFYEGEVESHPSEPTEPDGAGWEFVGATASTRWLYFFWRRPRVAAKAKGRIRKSSQNGDGGS